MAGDQPTVIKKYANRRLYHTGTSTYVTLDDLARMVKDGEEFVVTDAKTGLTNVHTVSPGVLVRGGQPSDLGFRTLRDDYRVRTVVNLNDATATTRSTPKCSRPSIRPPARARASTASR